MKSEESAFPAMPNTLQDFNTFRSRMNELILGAGNLTVNRFFGLDRQVYEAGALGSKTKEASLRRLRHLSRDPVP